MNAHDLHPDAETLAAFVEGAVTGTELERLAEHLAACEECRMVTGAAAAFAEIEEPGPARDRSWPWWLASAAAAAVIIAIVLLPRWRDPLRVLQPAAVRNHQARVTAFEHAPYRVTRDAQDETAYRRLAAAAELQERAESEPTPANLQRFAVAQLALGKTEAAVDLLVRASEAAPGDASILSDLSAAYIETGNPADAAERAGRALAIDPDLPSAAFNWALALEQSSNRPAAIAAWQRYLAIDSNSAWADEAREHLARLRQRAASWNEERRLLTPGVSPDVVRRVVSRFPQRARTLVQDELLPEWARTGSAGALALAEEIATVRSARGDHFLADVVAHAAPRRDVLREPIAQFARARATARRREADAAAVELDRAAILLREAGSPLWIVSAIFAANQDFYGGRGEQAIARTDELEPQLRADRHPAIAAELEWVRSLALGRAGRFGDALEGYERALQHATRAAETEHEVSLAILITGHLERAAERAVADEHRRLSLERLDESDSAPARMYTAYASAARAALAAGRPHLSRAFAESQAEVARQQADPLLTAESLLSRATALHRLGRDAEALSVLALARKDAATIPTAGLRDRTLADIEQAEAAVEIATRPCEAAKRFQVAIGMWQSRAWRIHEVAGRAGRAAALRSCGDRRGAEQELRAGIELLEAFRINYDEPALRLSYFDHAAGVFDELAALLLEDARFEEAFDVIEQKRARSLLDRVGGPEPSRPAKWSEIRHALPPDVMLLQYATVGESVWVWSGTRQRLRCGRAKESRTVIESRVNRHERSSRSGDEAVARREGRALFDQLLGHVDDIDRWSGRIAVVPDGALHRLSLSSLVMPDGRYVVEQWTTIVSPSATVLTRSGEPAGPPTRLLAIAVAAPRPDLPRLAEAEDELREVSHQYPQVTLLLESDATRRAFVEHAPHADAIHFTGHATTGSGLLFTGVAGALSARDIAALSLSSRPVVMLAACRTAAGKARATEGVDSVAVAFLHAGARDVVAALWDIDDRAAAMLSQRFHAALRQGRSAPEALRDAQLALLHGKDSRLSAPAAWAGVITMGSI